jgi:hypothetical protein
MGEIDDLLAAALRQRSGSLLLHGEAGIGKSALLDYARDASRGMTVLGPDTSRKHICPTACWTS